MLATNSFKFVKFRDEAWRTASALTVGHQQHPSRTPPWTWEYMFSRYYKTEGENWQEIALNKQDWNLHKKSWIKMMIGGTKVIEFGKV